MRVLSIFVIVLSVIVLSAGAVLFATSTGKYEAPVINCSIDKVIEAKVNVTDEELLSYVTATDNQDGDISDKIKVIRKNYMIEDNMTVVTFAVSDSDNNVTEINRKLILSDYESPKIFSKSDFVFPSGYAYNLAQYITASDVIDGDITNYVKLISSEFTNVSGRYPVNIKVSNSMGDITELVIKAIITDHDYFSTKIRLKEYITYTKVGAEPDYQSFIKDIYSTTPTDLKVDKIKIDSSEVDLTKPGIYDVYYRIYEKGSDEEVKTMSRLVVVVTEG